MAKPYTVLDIKGSITEDSLSKAIENLRAAPADHTIILRINSLGGHTSEMWKLADELALIDRSRIVSFCDGLAVSCAVNLLAIGAIRICTIGSIIAIHKCEALAGDKGVTLAVLEATIAFIERAPEQPYDLAIGSVSKAEAIKYITMIRDRNVAESQRVDDHLRAHGFPTELLALKNSRDDGLVVKVDGAEALRSGFLHDIVQDFSAIQELDL